MTENQQAPAASVDNAHRQARTSSGWLWCLGAVAVGAFLLAAFAILISSKQLQISPDTTYITGPLTPDGKRVDYFAAIEQATRPENAATDQNGYRLLVQHLGRHPDTDLEHFLAVCRKLGLDGNAIEPDVTFEEPFDFLTAYVASDKFDKTLLDKLPDRRDLTLAFDKRLYRPWTLDDLPMMAPWLDANGPALDLIGRAVRKPVFHIPMVRSEDEDLHYMPFPELQTVRSFSRALLARAHHRIAIGDIDGGIDDIITCKHLGRHLGCSPWLVDAAAGVSIEMYACAIGIAGSLEHPPTAAQLRQLQEESEDLPAEFDLDQKLLFERFAGLNAIQLLAHGRDVWLREEFSSRYLLPLAVDWNLVAKRFNEHFNAKAATIVAPPPVAFSPRLLFSPARDRSTWPTCWAACLSRRVLFAKQHRGAGASSI